METKGIRRILDIYENKTKTMEKCKYCNSQELTYNQLIMDSYCSDCGKWQEGENLNN